MADTLFSTTGISLPNLSLSSLTTPDLSSLMPDLSSLTPDLSSLTSLPSLSNISPPNISLPGLSGTTGTGGVMGTVLGGAGDAVSGVATGLANGVSTVVTDLDNVLSGLGDALADNTPDIPIVSGVVDAVATIVDDATDAVEIVVHHVMMMVAEIGQGVGTVGNATGDSLDAIVQGDMDGVLCILQDGTGKLVATSQQYVAAHLAHDAALIQIPLEMVSEALSEVLVSVIGKNIVSDAPYMLDGVQKLIIDEGLYKSVIVPLMAEWAKANDDAFGDIIGTLTPEEMGMGYDFNEDYWTDDSSSHHSGMDMTVPADDTTADGAANDIPDIITDFATAITAQQGDDVSDALAFA
ncbi:MAG: hypothetical protein ACK5II_14400 [Paracoccus sp. (in: a-proteobacteria)]